MSLFINESYSLATFGSIGNLDSRFHRSRVCQDDASGADSMKLLGAGLAFGIAAGGAGIGLGQVGAAGLAVISENPALQSKVFIFVGMVESIAIYGIVMMFIILGQ